MAILFTLRVFARNLLRGNRQKKKKLSEFYFVDWPRACTLALRLISQHSTYWTTATLYVTHEI